MKTQRSSSILLAAGLLTVVLLPSCSLPPGVAWREIQSEGLIPFLQNGMSAPKAQSQGQGLYAQQGSGNKVVEPPQPSINSVNKTPPVPSSAAFPPAYAVAGLAGYVRSPFTNPPRLVDVRGMNAGANVVCPYTQKPFVVPAAAVSSPVPRSATRQLAASNSQTQPKPQKRDVASIQPKPTPTPAPAPAPASAVVKTQPSPASTPTRAPEPKIANTPKPQPSAPPVTKPKPKETPQVAANTPSPTKTAPAPASAPSKIQTTPPPAAAPAPAAKLPYGTAISGRPGFVNSPYAEKHQLVDVTGLAVGTEVKCPYTGKLFRVPLQQQAKK